MTNPEVRNVEAQVTIGAEVFDLATINTASDVALAPLLSSVRRHLHAHPEVGFQEVNTARLITRVLEAAGLHVTGSLAGTGLFVDIVGNYDGPTIAYRADMDALPTVDHKTVWYASTKADAAHLCGHDAHTTIAIGLAIVLNGLRERLHGTVRVFFQPNEEGVPSGAPEMIRGGVLQNVDSVYAIHVDPTLPVGVIGLIKGAATAAADRFEVVVSGPGSGHSARPHNSVDTVWIATLIAQQLYQLVGRITDSRNAAVLTICRFQAGAAFNVIPGRVSFGGTLRCTDPSDRLLLKQRLIDAAHQIGALHHATVGVTYEDGAPPVINQPELVDLVAETVATTMGRGRVAWIPAPSMGAEDFAYYLESTPGLLVRLGTASSPATSYPLHDARFDIDENALVPAVRLMVEVLVRGLRLQAPARHNTEHG
jgi:amidohydrolase